MWEVSSRALAITVCLPHLLWAVFLLMRKQLRDNVEMADYLLLQIKKEEGKIKPRWSQNVFFKSDRRIVYTSMKEGESTYFVQTPVTWLKIWSDSMGGRLPETPRMGVYVISGFTSVTRHKPPPVRLHKHGQICKLRTVFPLDVSRLERLQTQSEWHTHDTLIWAWWGNQNANS